MKKIIRVNYRRSDNGRYTTAKFAKANPNTTEREVVRKAIAKKSK